MKSSLGGYTVIYQECNMVRTENTSCVSEISTPWNVLVVAFVSVTKVVQVVHNGIFICDDR